MADSKVWFITGCSTGFGRELAKLVLDRSVQEAFGLASAPLPRTPLMLTRTSG